MAFHLIGSHHFVHIMEETKSVAKDGHMHTEELVPKPECHCVIGEKIKRFWESGVHTWKTRVCQFLLLSSSK